MSALYYPEYDREDTPNPGIKDASKLDKIPHMDSAGGKRVTIERLENLIGQPLAHKNMKDMNLNPILRCA